MMVVFVPVNYWVESTWKQRMQCIEYLITACSVSQGSAVKLLKPQV